MKTLTIDESVFEQLRQLASKTGQDVNQYATAIISQGIRRAAELETGKAAARSVLEGPFVPFDPDAIRKRYMEKYGMPDLSHLSDEELADAADEEIAQMDANTRRELEEKGFYERRKWRSGTVVASLSRFVFGFIYGGRNGRRNPSTANYTRSAVAV